MTLQSLYRSHTQTRTRSLYLSVSLSLFVIFFCSYPLHHSICMFSDCAFLIQHYVFEYSRPFTLNRTLMSVFIVQWNLARIHTTSVLFSKSRDFPLFDYKFLDNWPIEHCCSRFFPPYSLFYICSLLFHSTPTSPGVLS